MYYGKEKLYIGYVQNGAINGLEVNPETVGQYTGLKDKNGREIYEGDILDFTVFDCFDNDKQYSGVVKFIGSRFMIWNSWESEFYGSDGGFDLDWVVEQDEEIEIVSSIHDNPEMMKGGSNEA